MNVSAPSRAPRRLRGEHAGEDEESAAFSAAHHAQSVLAFCPGSSPTSPRAGRHLTGCVMPNGTPLVEIHEDVLAGLAASQPNLS
jgi:hypothetical protein